MVHDILWALNPKMARAYHEAELASRVRVCKIGGLRKWPDVTRWEKGLYIDADSFMEAEMHLPQSMKDRNLGPDMRLEWKLLPKETALETVQGSRRGYVCFNKDMRFLRLMEKSRWNEWEIVMSVTPMEVLTQRVGVKRTRGVVIVGGLGLGWSLLKIANRAQVTEVHVVEKNERVLEHMVPILEPLLPKGKKITFRQGSVPECLVDGVRADVLFADIWNGYGNAEDKTEEFKAMLPNIGTVWCWGDCRGVD